MVSWPVTWPHVSSNSPSVTEVSELTESQDIALFSVGPCPPPAMPASKLPVSSAELGGVLEYPAELGGVSAKVARDAAELGGVAVASPAELGGVSRDSLRLTPRPGDIGDDEVSTEARLLVKEPLRPAELGGVLLTVALLLLKALKGPAELGGVSVDP